MDEVVIGKGKLAGKGVYAARAFKKGEVVKYWNLIELSKEGFNALPKSEHEFVHSFWGNIYLFPEPSRYTNHSADANTVADFENMCDIASRSISKGEMITNNAKLEVLKEVETFILFYENAEVYNFQWLEGGYRNASVSYRLRSGIQKKVVLKRAGGSFQIISEK